MKKTASEIADEVLRKLSNVLPALEQATPAPTRRPAPIPQGPLMGGKRPGAAPAPGALGPRKKRPISPPVSNLP